MRQRCTAEVTGDVGYLVVAKLAEKKVGCEVKRGVPKVRRNKGSEL